MKTDQNKIKFLRQCAAGVLLALLLLGLPARLRAQDYTYTTGDNSITITGYTGAGGNVTIPATIEDSPVTSIGRGAFQYNQTITNVTIPNGVTNIDEMGMSSCNNLLGVTIPRSMVSIGPAAFEYDKNLASITVPNGVIGKGSFRACGITNAVIGSGVTSIGANAFEYCAQLEWVYFEGNAPSVTPDAFVGVSDATVYHKPEATGWESTFGGLQTDVWNATAQTNTAAAGETHTNLAGSSDH